MRVSSFLFIILLSFVLSSCTNSTINDPNKAFERWTGIASENTEVNILHGQYWRSGHFTTEYEAIFKMTASKEWVNQLIEFNHLKPSEEQYIPKPIGGIVLDWFHPTSDYKIYTDNDSFTDLYLWAHTSSDTVYIFDRVL